MKKWLAVICAFCLGFSVATYGEEDAPIGTENEIVEESSVDVYIDDNDLEDEQFNIVLEDSTTVYITPYGERYHYRRTCAGKNAKATTQDIAEQIYGPCKKCAQ